MKRALPSVSDVLYRRFRRAVVSTALVAAFPAFPVFADPRTPPTQQPVAQSAPTADVCSEPLPTPREIEDVFAAFDVSLFEIPDGESAAFYRERLDALFNELRRVVSDYQTRRRDAGEKVSNLDPSLFTFATARFARGDESALPEGDLSTAVRFLDARKSLCRRLADSPELPADVRGQYYLSWLSFDAMFAVPRTPEAERDFLTAQLAEEEAKSPLDLGRVLTLRKHLRSAVEASERKPSSVAHDDRPLEQADVEKLFDVPEGESAGFYAARRDALTSAAVRKFISASQSDELSNRLREATDVASNLLALALRAEAKALDREALERLLDVPKGESAAFYLARLEELNDLSRRFTNYRRSAKLREFDALSSRLSNETLPNVYKRLAFADDLSPLDRFEYFERWVESCVAQTQLAALQNARDLALAANSPSEVDALKPDYLTLAILRTRLRVVSDAFDKARAQTSIGRTLSATSSNPRESESAPREYRDELLAVADELADRVADGPLPWALGQSWASVAEELVLAIDKLDPAVGTRFRKNVLATLAASDVASETCVKLRRRFEESVRRAEFIGSAVPVEAQNLDGTPFDWASYRGAPVLLEIVRLDDRGFVVGVRRPPFASELPPQYEKAGLRRLTFISATPEIARKFAENEKVRREHNANKDDEFARTLVCAKSTDSASGSDWRADYGLVWTQCWVLFDADGRVLSASPLPIQATARGDILYELKRLFPDVAPAERAR